jgi:hypothetical protein
VEIKDQHQATAEGLISWSSKRQHYVTTSSTEAEYIGQVNAIKQIITATQFLLELRLPIIHTPGIRRTDATNETLFPRFSHEGFLLGFIEARCNRRPDLRLGQGGLADGTSPNAGDDEGEHAHELEEWKRNDQNTVLFFPLGFNEAVGSNVCSTPR